MKDSKIEIRSPEITTRQSSPTVEYANGAEEIADVTIDTEWFADFMRQRGMSEEEITSTTILVTTGLNSNLDDEDKETMKGGHYDPTTKTVAVDIAAKKWLLTEDPTLMDEPGYPQPPQVINEAASMMLSEDAIHEATHRAQHTAGKNMQALLDHYDSLVPEGVFYRLVKKLTTADPKSQEALQNIRKLKLQKAILKRDDHEHYLGEPDEIEARTVAEQEIAKLSKDGVYPVEVRFKDL